MQGPQDHTIVMGASMAGLLAACVLPEHYQRVTVTEPDVLPTGEHRRGVIAGVRVHEREGLMTAIAANLVVDATGRGSRTPVWLRTAP